jgi:DNA-binding NarL/FixJ family response regulator
LTWTRPDGQKITTMVSPAGVHDANGEIKATIAVITDISELKRTAAMLEQSGQALESQRATLNEKDAALKQVFDHLEQEKAAYKKHICADIEMELKPLLKSIRQECPPHERGRIDSLSRRLGTLLNQDVDLFTRRFAELTPREREICLLIKDGMSSKEMSQRLNLSLLTIHKHRENIRRKLKVSNKDINLSTYLHFR